MRTRKDKIQFLKGLMTGQRKLNELRPVKNYGFNKQENPELYKGINNDLTLTREQLDELQKENPNSHFFIFVNPGTPPEPGAIHLDFNLAS